MSVDGIVWDSWKTWWDSIWPHGFNMFQSMDGTRQVEPVEGSKPKMKRGLEGAGERQCGLWEWYYGKRWQANKMVFRDLKQQNGRRSCKNLASWNGQQWDRYIYIYLYTVINPVCNSHDQHWPAPANISRSSHSLDGFVDISTTSGQVGVLPYPKTLRLALRIVWFLVTGRS